MSFVIYLPVQNLYLPFCIRNFDIISVLIPIPRKIFKLIVEYFGESDVNIRCFFVCFCADMQRERLPEVMRPLREENLSGVQSVTRGGAEKGSVSNKQSDQTRTSPVV